MTERKTVEQLYRGTHALADAVVCDQLGSMQFVFSAEKIERNAWANDDYNPWYMDDSPFGGRIITPVFLAFFDATLFYGHFTYPPGGSLFATQDFEYIVPVKVGTDYTMTGTLVSIYQRRGRTFYVTRMSVTDAHGTEVMQLSKTVATSVRPVAALDDVGADRTGTSQASPVQVAPAAHRAPRSTELPADPTAFCASTIWASRDTQDRQELEPIIKQLSLDKSRIYQGWPTVRNRHTDYQAAKATGLRELFIKFFGTGFVGGSLSVKFIGFVAIDDTVTVRGVVTDRDTEGDRVKLTVDLRAENRRGAKVVAGTATGYAD
jgi:acyl dehydratase